MAEMRADFDVHVSGPKAIDKVVTPSYVSTNEAGAAAGRCFHGRLHDCCMNEARKMPLSRPAGAMPWADTRAAAV
jgi:hypothetical protein